MFTLNNVNSTCDTVTHSRITQSKQFEIIELYCHLRLPSTVVVTLKQNIGKSAQMHINNDITNKENSTSI